MKHDFYNIEDNGDYETTVAQMTFDLVAYNGLSFDELKQKMADGTLPEMSAKEVYNIIFTLLPVEIAELNKLVKECDDLLSKVTFLAQANHVYSSLYNFFHGLYKIESDIMEELHGIYNEELCDEELCDDKFIVFDPVKESGAGSWEDYYDNGDY